MEIRTGAAAVNSAGIGLVLVSEKTVVRQQSADMASELASSGQHGSDAHSLSNVHMVIVVAPESSQERRTSDAVGDARPTTRIIQICITFRSIECWEYTPAAA